MTADLCRLGAMTRGVILSLGLAVDDLEAGHYGTEDRERLASYLDNLAHALRCPGGHDLDRVVDGRRVDR